jgi:hypothetical protein
MLFDGSNDVVTVTNTESIDLNNQLATAFSLEFWVNPTSDGEANTGEIFNKGTSTYCRTTNDDATFVDLECSLDLAAAGSNATLTITDGLRLNTWQHVALTYTDDADDEITLFIDGVYRGVSTNGSGSPETDTSNLLFGGGTSYNFHGYLDETKVFAYERSVDQIKSDYILGAASAGSSAAIGVGTTAMPTPAAHWKFDDMSGTTAQDAGSGNLDLTLSAASWTRSGKFGGAFNGTGGAVRASRADEANLQFAAADSFTLSTWVKSDAATNPAAIEYILAQGATSAAGYALYFNTSGFACVAIDDDTSWGTPDTAACSSTDYYDGTWHHLVGVRNVASDTLSLYVDGVQKASTTDTTTATLDSNGVTYVADMDADDAGSGEEFAGDIDEVKIYRSALTTAQIATDMNADSAANLGLGVNEQAAIADGDYQSTLVGYWPLDENVDNTCTGGINDVCDRSGSTNDGPNNATPIWVSGKFGSALRYSAGSSQYTSIAGPSSVKTVSFWINPQDDTEPMLNVTSTSDYITSSAGAVSATGFSSPSIYVNGILNGSVQGSYWNHVVVASDTAENASDLYFGRANASYLTGSIDEVRLFSAKLTAAQVAHEYSRGEPVAWYRFDECTGATANDAAEIIPLPTLRPNSTITIGGTGTYTATGNCTSGTSTHAWYAGASGKYGSALALDGTNDYAVSPNAAVVVPTGGTYSGVSWGAWIKPISSAASKTIIHKNNEFRLTTNASSQPVCEIYAASWQTGATHSTALSLDTWSHVMCVYNGSTITTYIDGIASSTQAETDAITSTNTTALSVGRDSAGSGYVQGLLDEVRVYNYPLSPVQLQQVMTGGSTRFE